MWLPFVLICLTISDSELLGQNTLDNLKNQCKNDCDDTSLTFPLEKSSLLWPKNLLDPCDYSCHTKFCSTGCAHWAPKKSFDDCEHSCFSVSFAPHHSWADDSCGNGCHNARSIFLGRLKSFLGAARLSLSLIHPEQDNTLEIKWEFSSDNIEEKELISWGLNFGIVGRIYPNSEWISLSSQIRPALEGKYEVKALDGKNIHSNRRYEFRLLAISEMANGEKFKLTSNVGIKEIPFNKIDIPSTSPPEIQSHFQISSAQYKICWKNPGYFFKTDQIFIEIQINDQISLSGKKRNLLVRLDRYCQTLTGLESGKSYEATLTYRHNEKMSPSIKISFAMKKASVTQSAKLIFAEKSQIFLLEDALNFGLINGTKVIFEIDKDDEITAIQSTSESEILIGTAHGHLYYGHLEDGKLSKKGILYSSPTKSPVAKISVDFIEAKVYVVYEKKILVCNVKSCKNRYNLIANSYFPLKDAEIDYWNGFLYLITNKGQLLKSALFPITDLKPDQKIDISSSISQLYLPNNVKAEALTIDISIHNQLIVASQEKVTYAINLSDMQKIRLLNETIDGRPAQHDARRLAFVHSKDMLIHVRNSCEKGDFCVWAEEFLPRKNVFRESPYLLIGKIIDVAILEKKPIPYELQKMADLELYFSRFEAYLHPIITSLPYQNSVYWRQSEYQTKFFKITSSGAEQELLEGNKMSANRKSWREKFYSIPATHYRVNVRQCLPGNSTCSDWISADGMTMGDRINQDTTMILMGIDNEQIEIDLSDPNVERRVEFQYSAIVRNSTCLEYDSEMSTLYYESENSLLRGDPSQNNVQRLSHFSHGMQCALLARKGYLLLSNEYDLMLMRTTGSITDILSTCDSKSCHQILAVAADVRNQRFILVKRDSDNSAVVKELKVNQEEKIEETEKSLGKIQEFPSIKQMKIVGGTHILFVSNENRLGIVPMLLTSAVKQYYFPAKDVGKILFKVSKSKPKPALLITDIQLKSDGSNSTIEIQGQNLIPFSTLYKIKLFDLQNQTLYQSVSFNPEFQFPTEILETQSDNFVDISASTARQISGLNKKVSGNWPRNFAGFVSHVETPWNFSARVDLIWDEPLKSNAQPMGYKITCLKSPNNETIEAEVSKNQLQYTINYLPLNSQLECQVLAIGNEGVDGGWSKKINVKTENENPPLIQILALDHKGKLLETTLGRATGRTINQMPFSQLTAFSDRIYLKNFDPNFDVLYRIEIGGTEKKKLQINNIPKNIQHLIGDWVGQKLIAISENNGNIKFSELPLMFQKELSFNKLPPVNSLVLASISNAKLGHFVLNPLFNIMYFINSDKYSLGSLDFNEKNPKVKEISDQFDCLKNRQLFSLCGRYKKTRFQLIAITKSREILILRPNEKNCEVLTIKLGQESNPDTKIQCVQDQIFLIGKNNNGIVHLNLSDEKGDPTIIPSTSGLKISNFHIYSPKDEPYPHYTCLQPPSNKNIKFDAKSHSKYGAIITIEPLEPIEVCKHYSQPTAIYTAYVQKREGQQRAFSQQIVGSVNMWHELKFEGLEAYTEYEASITVENFYTDSTQSSVSPRISFMTSFGYPSAPRSVSAVPVAPDQILVLWEPPEKSGGHSQGLRYKILLTDEIFITPQLNKTAKTVDFCKNYICKKILGGLKSQEELRIRITAFQSEYINISNPDGISEEIYATTFPDPGILSEKVTRSENITLKWQPKNAKNVLEINIGYQKAGNSQTWHQMGKIVPDQYSETTILKLRPATAYDIRYIAVYNTKYSYKERSFNEKTSYFHSIGSKRTRAETPSTPTSVKFEWRSGTGRYRLIWGAPENDGGSNILGYVLNYTDSSLSDKHWMTKELPATQREFFFPKNYENQSSIQFRLAARNVEGVGRYYDSREAEIDDSEHDNKTGIIIAVLVSILLFVILTFLIIIFVIRRRKKGHGKKWGSFEMGQVNQGYSAQSHKPFGKQDSLFNPLDQIPDEDMKALPHVARRCVTISRILGKGAFGEVFEGLAWNLPRVGPKSVKVAIKTLRTGARNDERVKFIKEAIIMSYFDHENIVKLLGVCLEVEPHWIILELMEGGDLLTFLRSARPTMTIPSQVSLKDLLNLSIDVLRGCAYLEKIHHIHRDLAARNCLLTTRNPETRVVKIADFGLTRDTYEMDYYRVDGQGLLPVRWMAPESMVDGVFTIKTDVWSFGVLFWEIITLGQQPYHGKTNFEVLNFVRLKSTLDKPEYCPERIYQLMQKCWKFDHSERPPFSQVLNEMELLTKSGEYDADMPFPLPPKAPVSQPQTISKNRTRAKTAVEVFTTDNSARFSRRRTASIRSLKENREQPPAQRRARIFRSMRKEKPKPPRLPSKSELDTISLRSQSRMSTDVMTAGKSCADENLRNSESRPISGGAFSSGAESYTTDREGYEVPLVKGLTNFARNQQQMVENGAYERPKSSGDYVGYHRQARPKGRAPDPPSTDSPTSTSRYLSAPVQKKKPLVITTPAIDSDSQISPMPSSIDSNRTSTTTLFVSGSELPSRTPTPTTAKPTEL